MCYIYWVIANLPIRPRSTLSSIYLAVFYKTVHVKQHGYSKILEPLIRNPLHLETTGVFVQRLRFYVKVLFCMGLLITWVHTHLLDIKSLSMLRKFKDFVWLTVKIFSSILFEVELLP